MSKAINLTFNSSMNEKAIRELEDYVNWLQGKAIELAKRLADIGKVNITLGYSRAVYKGQKHVEVDVEPRDENTFAIVASGETVLILEFGAGVTYGYGHPQADEFGYGPGTYPGQTHAMDKGGWWIPKSAGGGHTYGNPPSMTMYQAAKDLRSDLTKIAREVFSA